MAAIPFDKRQANKPDGADLTGRARQLKALADADRLRLVACLLKSEMSVSDLADETRMSIAKASHHLAVLRRARLLVARKQGRHIFYSIPSEFTGTGHAANHRIDLGWCQLGLLPERPRLKARRTRIR